MACLNQWNLAQERNFYGNKEAPVHAGDRVGPFKAYHNCPPFPNNDVKETVGRSRVRASNPVPHPNIPVRGSWYQSGPVQTPVCQTAPRIGGGGWFIDDGGRPTEGLWAARLLAHSLPCSSEHVDTSLPTSVIPNVSFIFPPSRFFFSLAAFFTVILYLLSWFKNLISVIK